MLQKSRLIITLFKKDILLEFRQQYSFYGVLLYVASTIFVLNMAMGQPENMVWNGLYLDDAIVYMCKCCRKNISAGREGQATLFLFPLQSNSFYTLANSIQHDADVINEWD